ncbi:hypothetical protein [Streptomyces sp. NPDC048521]|uniref:hypothetical protein n=1 Tax=Streptomyces sp. NPDC048521 TaxID=3365566 RepID=UPI003711280A
MRSARMLLATAAAGAALAIASPGVALASHGGDDGGRDDSSYSRDHDSDSDHDKGSGKDHDKGSGKDHDKDYGKEHDDDGGRDEPRGGMHTGGGALASVLGSDDWGSGSGSGSGRDDSRFDPDSYKDKGQDGGRGKDEWGGGEDKEKEKPHGGMHTGGGALATPGVTAGGLAVLAVGATGMYALRRKKATAPAS